MKRPLAILCLALTGCTASNVPITSSAPPNDAALIGQWRLNLNDLGEDEAEGDMDVVDISRAADGRLQVTDVTSDGTQDPRSNLVLITAAIDGQHYASLGVIEEGAKKSRYLLMRYEIETPSRVQIYSAPFEALEDAVKHGWIRGKEEADRHFSTFVLETGEEELHTFIAAHGRRLYSVKGAVIERVETTTPRRR